MKERKNNKTVNLLVVLLVLGINMSIVGTVAALTEIPAGATIESATLSVYADMVHGNVVNVHRVTADWQENVVTWENFGGYDPTIEGSFTASAAGSYSVDVTDLVQGWVDGEPNYGVLLEQGVTHYTRYVSSEHGEVAKRPKLEITYTAGGDPVTVTIQRLGEGTVQVDVADSYVWEFDPDLNRGWEPLLFSGYYDSAPGLDKYVLIRFDFTSDSGDVGTGTPGYWMNHPEAWPVDEITIGGITYAKGDAIAFMKSAVKNDKTYTMFSALVAAKLNVLIGNESGCVDTTIAAADIWMAGWPVGSGVKAGGKGSAWRDAEALHKTLDDYNNGLLCATSRDDLELE